MKESRRVGYRRIAVTFPIELFNRIKARAKKNESSFSSTAVDLAACGLLDLEDLERHEQILPRQAEGSPGGP